METVTIETFKKNPPVVTLQEIDALLPLKDKVALNALSYELEPEVKDVLIRSTRYYDFDGYYLASNNILPRIEKNYLDFYKIAESFDFPVEGVVKIKMAFTYLREFVRFCDALKGLI